MSSSPSIDTTAIVTPTRLTIGMATYDDYSGVYFTLQATRLQAIAEGLTERIEWLVVDNHPVGSSAAKLRQLCGLAGARYVPLADPVGTAAPRDRVFREATTEAVLCLDAHVLLWPGALTQLLAWYDEHPDALDLVQGPLVYDDGHSFATHLADAWRGGTWGTWACQSGFTAQTTEPFEIGAQGLGLFSCRTAGWVGFHPEFREFGGEEWYLHHKFRQAGRRCWCLPALKWFHRFGDPDAGRRSPTSLRGRIRNDVLGHRELGLDLDRCRRHFVTGWNEVDHTHDLPPALSSADWDQIVREADVVSRPTGQNSQARMVASSSGDSTSSAPAIDNIASSVTEDSVAAVAAANHPADARLLAALQPVLRASPEWIVVIHPEQQPGMLALSRRQEDRPRLPGWFTQAKSLGQAAVRAAEQAWTGAAGESASAGEPVLWLPADESTTAQRRDRCAVCPRRSGNRCAECGCYIAAKTRLASERCPLGRW